MKTTQDPQIKVEGQPSSHDSQEQPCNHQNSVVAEADGTDTGSVSNTSCNNKKVSREDIELVQNLIERCLQLYMNREEVIRILSTRARIEPAFTTLVWQKLEEENKEFFRAYYIRLKLKRQIILFNHLLEHQYHLMKYPAPPKVPLAPIQNGIHPMAVNNIPMGYPVLQQPVIPNTGQPHLDQMACGLPFNGIPHPGSFHPIRMNSGNVTVMNDALPEVAATAPSGALPDMAVSPASVASSNHFPFTASEISGMGMDSSAFDVNFQSDLANTGELQLGPDGGVGPSRDSIRSLGQLWNFSLSDLSADFTNLGDLGALGDYTGSPFLPSDSDILMDSPDQDGSVEEYFADTVVGACSQSDDEKP